MDASQRDFYARIARVTKRHRAMGAGYTARLQGDGLIIVQPRQIRFRLPVRGFVLLMAAFMIFKGFLLAYMGDAEYDARLAVLRTTTYGDIGAFIMGIDPVSQTLATSLSHFLR